VNAMAPSSRRSLPLDWMIWGSRTFPDSSKQVQTIATGRESRSCDEDAELIAPGALRSPQVLLKPESQSTLHFQPYSTTAATGFPPCVTGWNRTAAMHFAAAASNCSDPDERLTTAVETAPAASIFRPRVVSPPSNLPAAAAE